MDSDLKVTLPGLQIGCERTLASLQVPELIADTTRVAVTPGNRVLSPPVMKSRQRLMPRSTC